jgi:hypothetical protein
MTQDDAQQMSDEKRRSPGALYSRSSEQHEKSSAPPCFRASVVKKTFLMKDHFAAAAGLRLPDFVGVAGRSDRVWERNHV